MSERIDVPRRTEDATPAFVTRALRDRGILDAATVVAEVEHEPVGVGVGIVGQLARLTVRYDGTAAGAPGTVILKLPSQFPANRAVGDHFNFYEREGRFYQQLAGKLPVRTPRCYWNLIDPERDEFGLLLEDLGSRTMISQVAGVGADRAQQALVSLAGLHRELWESPALDAFSWMPNFNDQINLNAGQSYRDAWPLFVERVGPVLPEGAVALGERLKESFEAVMHQSFTASPRTVLHGDFRIDNLLFDDSAAPEERVGVLDWQIAGRGPGVFDVAYLLSGSMAVEERRTAETEVVRAWFDALASPGGYSYDDAWREYRRTSLVTTVYGVIPAAQMDPANERGRELVEAMGVRSFTACLDLDAAELLP